MTAERLFSISKNSIKLMKNNDISVIIIAEFEILQFNNLKKNKLQQYLSL